MSQSLLSRNACIYYYTIIDQYTLTLGNTSKQFGADNVTVTVEWAEQTHTTYSVRVMPVVPIIVTGSTNCQLTISYNIKYNLSVEAIAPCGANATAFIRLHYGEA